MSQLNSIRALVFLSLSIALIHTNATAKVLKTVYLGNGIQVDYIASQKTSPKGQCQFTTEYPQIKGALNKAIEAQLNEHLRATIIPPDNYIAECDNEVVKESPRFPGRDIEERFQAGLYLNGKDIISVSYGGVRSYPDSLTSAPRSGGAFTASLKTGQFYEFKDLFKPGASNLAKLNKLIYEKIKTAQPAGDKLPPSKEEGQANAEKFKLTSRLGSTNERDEYRFVLRRNLLTFHDLFGPEDRTDLYFRSISVELKPAEIKHLINPKGPLRQVFYP
jgi:hypothetical protein